ncbi:MAG: hypothetical protein A3F84_08380 [Candidatus Handelsmanbacteria bacterium RIFCSPLOWO2_12_FULL_64_10]|uniref:Terminase n=1 Tax=Handelsmanbacteria sp. (strain RIFCSPLOWO2_12_FULL_64_10) TaxID=1817868 RepID=A0A1F6D5N3_HANXR|nr:MAG: hypothetical protein A3F84_08380 [Candidatus Handelsmanbacteria bacterium RIFCSPLOWO2_12_FULL_64_10]
MPGGRPSKLNPALQKRIVQAIRRGCYVETAAALAGLHKDTFYAWLKKGAQEDGEKIYRDFSAAVEKALAESERDDLAVIEKAGRGYEVTKEKTVVYKDGSVETTTETSTRFNWQAAAWRLERRFPERWAKIDRDLEKRLAALEEQLNVKG